MHNYLCAVLATFRLPEFCWKKGIVTWMLYFFCSPDWIRICDNIEAMKQLPVNESTREFLRFWKYNTTSEQRLNWLESFSYVRRKLTYVLSKHMPHFHL